MNSLPSPAVSPAPSNSDANSPIASQGRKRARSSVSSVTSSSKRAMSEDATAATAMADNTTDPPRSQSLLAPRQAVRSANDDEIDAYMLDQETSDGSATSVVHRPPSPPDDGDTSAQSRYNKVRDIITEKKMARGETWYLVSRSWYRRWEKACTGEIDKDGVVLESQLGPVDNSDLMYEWGRLKHTVREGIEVEFVPLAVWKLFVQWYGTPQIELPRTVIVRGINQELVLELFPPVFDVCLLEDRETTTIQQTEGKSITISSQDVLKTLYDKVSSALSVSINEGCRLWQVENMLIRPSKLPSAMFKRAGGRILPDTDSQQTVEEALLQNGDTLVLEVKTGGKWIVNLDEMIAPDPAASGQQVLSSLALMNSNDPLFASGSDFFSKLSSRNERGPIASSSNSSLHRSVTIQLNVNAQSNSSSYGKGRAEKRGSPPGTVGLSNMGNTCFMNSALQCLVHTQELAEYFLADVYKDELNVDNPLGMGGAIAEAFGALIDRIWAGGASSSYSPRDFKLALQRFAPQFSGYQQHDSQELVAFLLDGLHEDLNRVLRKPYVEKPDWEGGGDKDLVKLAKTSWEGYMKRNDSVIVDLFQGQYRSTLVCPTCEKVSITFDPFMYLTLPLPVQKKWTHNIYYVPWDTSKPHVKVTVEVNRNASFKDVRQLLGRWMEVESDNLLTLETFSHRFYKNLDDVTYVNEMQDHDVIVCFELPCHAQQSRSWKPHPDPSKNPLIIPVHLTKDSSLGHMSYGRSGFAHPFVIVLSQEDTRDKQKIYAAIIERLERWTRHSRDLYQWEEDVVMDEVRVSPKQMDSLVEIKENGDVVPVDEDIPEEGDIVDERAIIMTDEDSSDAVVNGESVLRKIGPKPDLFEMHIQNAQEKYVMNHSYSSNYRDRWSLRVNNPDPDAPLLREGDALFCEWDDNFRSYYFGDDNRYEHGLWGEASWTEFVHPELTEARAAANAKKGKGLTLLDCLEEFTKEEQLGEDDLWYCPRCKDHKQATKKFDLWTVPDILVVHLKRFSNSRVLRDKIDAFIDFPVEGLDLGPFCVERQVAQKLVEDGADAEELGLRDLDEPLIYDLYAVDEHLGGLGGGHYRAYAKNHVNDKWYHFDDSYVTPAQATDAVNANAYLLFYKRRTERPLGGKSFQKLEETRAAALAAEAAEGAYDNQLPTPPEEPLILDARAGLSKNSIDVAPRSPAIPDGKLWASLRSVPESDSDEPPSFEDSQLDETVDLGLMLQTSYDYPDPSSANSPSSSNEAEPDWDKDSNALGFEEWQTGVGYDDRPPSRVDNNPDVSAWEHDPSADGRAWLLQSTAMDTSSSNDVMKERTD